jgi:hypothetical protein
VKSQNSQSTPGDSTNKFFKEQRVLKRPIQVSQEFKSFTTHRKKTTLQLSRKGMVCYEKCRQLTEIALSLTVDRRISEQDLTDLVTDYVASDIGSVRKYVGYNGRVSRSSCGNSHVIGFRRSGYLERWGFMKRLKPGIWAIFEQTIFGERLTPLPLEKNHVEQEATESVHLINESFTGKIIKLESKEKIFLSTSKSKEVQKVVVEARLDEYNAEYDVGNNDNINNNNNKEKKNFSSIHESESNLSSIEMSILKASPGPPEPDKAKIKWPNMPPLIQFEQTASENHEDSDEQEENVE